jgi:DNA mismatch endonuclease, patch repair protein
MAAIKGKNTKPELLVRSWLHKHGFRFRLHQKDLPGKPDIVLPKYRTVIFVHGCFWHSHGCKNSVVPRTRREFWIEKLRMNWTRDRKSIRELRGLGWHTRTVWECDVRANAEKTLYRLRGVIRKGARLAPQPTLDGKGASGAKKQLNSFRQL